MIMVRVTLYKEMVLHDRKKGSGKGERRRTAQEEADNAAPTGERGSAEVGEPDSSAPRRRKRGAKKQHAEL